MSAAKKIGKTKPDKMLKSLGFIKLFSFFDSWAWAFACCLGF